MVSLNAFSVLGNPNGDTQNTRDLGTGVPKTRGYPHCYTGLQGIIKSNVKSPC